MKINFKPGQLFYKLWRNFPAPALLCLVAFLTFSIDGFLPFQKDLRVTLNDIGTASVYYIDPETSEKQLIESVGLLPAEEVEHSGFMATLEIGAAIFKSYWFLFAIGLIVLVVVIYLIASKIHRNRQKKNRDVKRYRNL